MMKQSLKRKFKFTLKGVLDGAHEFVCEKLSEPI